MRRQGLSRAAGHDGHMNLQRAAAALLAGLVLAGCGGGAAPSRNEPAATPSKTPKTRVQSCIESVDYWAKEILKAGRDQGFDYQEMGLSDAQYRMVREVVDQAKPVRQRDGLAAALALVDKEAPRLCKAHYATATATPTGGTGGWPNG
jgi:hypothetical protein